MAFPHSPSYFPKAPCCMETLITALSLTAGPAVSYSGFQQPVRLPPPTLGQHTSEVLQDILDYDQEAVNQLRDSASI